MPVDMTSSPSQIFRTTQEGRNHVLFHFSIKVRSYAKSLKKFLTKKSSVARYDLVKQSLVPRHYFTLFQNHRQGCLQIGSFGKVEAVNNEAVFCIQEQPEFMMILKIVVL